MRPLLCIAALACAAVAPDAGPTDVGDVTLVDGGSLGGKRYLIIVIPAPTDHDCRPVPSSDCEI